MPTATRIRSTAPRETDITPANLPPITTLYPGNGTGSVLVNGTGPSSALILNDGGPTTVVIGGTSPNSTLDINSSSSDNITVGWNLSPSRTTGAAGGSTQGILGNISLDSTSLLDADDLDD